jgi:hypothetical protein
LSTDLKLAASEYVEVVAVDDANDIHLIRVVGLITPHSFTMSWVAPG